MSHYKSRDLHYRCIFIVQEFFCNQIMQGNEIFNETHYDLEKPEIIYIDVALFKLGI